MENKKQGYKVRKYQGPVKRYCQMLNLKNDAALIAEYRKRHSEGKVWPETLAAIREVGILEMEIYILGTNLFMIVETPLDFDWDTAMARMATLPRQAEWEEYMSVFQQAEPGASSAEKWQLMDRMFYLYGSKKVMQIAEKDRLRFTILSSILLIACPVAIEWIFNKLTVVLN